MTTPRPYQTQAVADCRAAFVAGAQAVLLQLPTGAGKTFVAGMVVEESEARGLRVLVLAQRRELVTQLASRLPGPVGVVMAGCKGHPAARVQVGSVDTINAREVPKDIGLILIDEAHHATCESIRNIIEACPGAYILGLTATPQRADGAAMGDVFDTLVTGPSIRDLMTLGVLVECDVVAASPGRSLARDPVEGWLEFAGDRPGFIFAPTIPDSKRWCLGLLQNGINAAHIDGGTPHRERDEIIHHFRSGAIDVLSSVYIFTEGFDAPRAEVCMLARGCGNPGTFLQMVGRVLRSSPGKERALLIDLKGVVHEHGLPSDDRVWSLEGTASRLSKPGIALTQCPQCGAVWRSGERRICFRCEWEMPPPKSPAVVRREMELIEQKRLRRELEVEQNKKRLHPASELARLKMEAKMKGHHIKWVGVKYRHLFGEWPKGLYR
ncbi:MAG: DEAD/DEAH box helicase [Acidimicrobiales bacterium]